MVDNLLCHVLSGGIAMALIFTLTKEGLFKSRLVLDLDHRISSCEIVCI